MKKAELGNLGKRVKFARKQAGLNQTEFAKKLGLSGPTAISKYELSQREPELALLVKIARLGNVDPGWLLTGKEPKEEIYTPLERENINKLVTIFRDKDERARELVIQNLDLLVRLPGSPKKRKKPAICMICQRPQGEREEDCLCKKDKAVQG